MSGAETKLTMSLDDLIAQASKKRDRKPQQPRQSGAPAPQSGPRKGLNRNRQKNAANGAVQQQPPKQQQQQQQPKQQQQQQQPQRQAQGQQGGQRNRKGGGSNLGVRGGQVQKRSVIEVPVKMIRQPLQAPAPARRQPPQQRQPAPDGKWEHDLYSDDYVPARRAPVSQVGPANTKLIITNLHHQVSEDDLLELFSTCGTVKTARINFDNSGRSLGTGWIVYETRAEAEAAKKEYHQVKLDGKPMEITLADSLYSGAGAGSAGLRKLSSGISVQKPGAGGVGGGGGRAGGSGGADKPGSGGQRLAAAAIRETAAAARPGGRGGARGGRLRSAVVGQAQLDADLRDYMQE